MGTPSPRNQTMLEHLLLGIVADPQAEDRWLVLADWLEEHDDPRRGELLRLHRKLLATCCEPDRHPERAGWQARVVELIGQGVRPCVPQRTVVLGGGVGMTFNFIPPGSFLMGSPPQEEGHGGDEVLHRVSLTSGFWMGVYPVTQSRWRAITGDDPSLFPGGELPVETVSWQDCQEFAGKLGEKCRLPSEAEWEYTCRAGTTTPFFLGETISTDQANYDGNHLYGQGKKGVYRRKTTPVGSFPANAWGLFDMHGNVWEWCRDGDADYRKRNPYGPPVGSGGEARVLRGGSWVNEPWSCRSASRFCSDPGNRFLYAGCRVLLCPDDRGA